MEKEWPRAHKGSRCPHTYATGPGPRDASAFGEPLAFGAGQAELTSLGLRTAGSRVLGLVFLAVSEGHLSRGFSSQPLPRGATCRGRTSTFRSTGSIGPFHLTLGETLCLGVRGDLPCWGPAVWLQMCCPAFSPPLHPHTAPRPFLPL